MLSRIDEFSGSFEDYVRYLEDTVLDLRSRFATVPRLASTVAGKRRLQEHSQIIGNLEDLQEEEDHQIRPSPQKKPRELEIVQWKPGTDDTPARTSSNAPWRRLAKTLVQETPFASDWAATLRKNGLHDMMSTGKAVSILLGPEYELNESFPRDRLPTIEDEQGAFRRVTDYARAAAQNGINASAALMLANFQKFLVFCLCSVMRDNGVSQSDVNGVVRICLGDVSNDYCNRVLRAAVYLNQLVDALYMNGWGLRASELLLLCKDLLQSSRMTR